MQAPQNFTQLLTEWSSGQPQALERLAPLVYDELRKLARNYMRAERGSHTLQATAVVHEAFMRLIQANVSLAEATKRVQAEETRAYGRRSFAKLAGLTTAEVDAQRAARGLMPVRW